MILEGERQEKTKFDRMLEEKRNMKDSLDREMAVKRKQKENDKLADMAEARRVKEGVEYMNKVAEDETNKVRDSNLTNKKLLLQQVDEQRLMKMRHNKMDPKDAGLNKALLKEMRKTLSKPTI